MQPHHRFERSALEWITPPPLHPKAGPPFGGLQNRDLDLLRLIVEARYLLIRQAAEVGFTDYSLAAKRLRQMEQYGWVQRAKLPKSPGSPNLPRYVYSLTDQGLSWLRQLDPDWAETHETFEALAGKTILQDKVWHEILRTDAAQRLVQTAREAGLDALWLHGSAGSLRAYPFGPQGERFVLVPDAVVDIEGHRWLLELERSWRTTTAAEKARQYTIYFEQQLWEQKYWGHAPRLLFVLTESSTQHASWDQWSQEMTLLRTPWAKVILFSQLDQTPIQVARLNPRDAHIEQESWLDLNAPNTTRV